MGDGPQLSLDGTTMTDLGISIALLVAIVLLSEATRRTAARLVSQKQDYWIYLLEIASTFQLCACTHELKILGEVARIEPHIGLTLTYVITVIHVLTFQDALCNPIGALELAYRGRSSGKRAFLLILCQFVGAIAAQLFAAAVWTLGMSDLHVKHERFGFRCFNPIGGSVMEALAVELACSFAMQAAVLHLYKLHEKLRVHAVAAAITSLVYLGGNISGAIFNPILAFSIQFPCSGNTFLEYSFVYWLGPVLGVASCILLFEKIIPFLSGKSTAGLDASVEKKKLQ